MVTEGKTCSLFRYVPCLHDPGDTGVVTSDGLLSQYGETDSIFHSNDKCIGPSSGVITGPIKEIQNPVERRSWMCWCTDPASCLSEDQSNAPEVRDVVEPVQNVELVERDSNAPAEVAMYFCKQADYGQCQLFQFVKQACGKSLSRLISYSAIGGEADEVLYQSKSRITCQPSIRRFSSRALIALCTGA